MKNHSIHHPEDWVAMQRYATVFQKEGRKEGRENDVMLIKKRTLRKSVFSVKDRKCGEVRDVEMVFKTRPL